MKQFLRLGLIVLVACLLLSGIAFAEDAGPVLAPADRAASIAATGALRNWIDEGHPVNGVKGAKLATDARPGVTSKAAGPKRLSLAPMPAEICTQSSFMANRYTNPFSFHHPILYTASTSDPFTITPSVSGGGKYAAIETDEIEGVTYYYLVGLKPGTVRLTITAPNGVKATKIIRIKNKVIMSSLAIYSTDEHGDIIKASPRLTLTLTGITKKASRPMVHPLIVTSSPTSASYGGITFDERIVLPTAAIRIRTSNSGVADVSDVTGMYVNALYPKRPGKATISVWATDGGNAKATVKLTVKGYPVESVSLDEYGPSVAVLPGTSKLLRAAVYPMEAFDKSLIWSSSNRNVATVDGTGNVTGIVTGRATITCLNKASGKSDRIAVKVGYGATQAGSVYRFFGFRGTDETFRINDLNMMASVYTQAYGSDNVHVGDGAFELSDLEDMISAANSLGIKENDVTVVYFTAEAESYFESERYRGALLDANRDAVTVDTVQFLLEQIPGTVVLFVDSNCSGLFTSTQQVSPAIRLRRAKSFNNAWVSAFSSSRANNFTAKGAQVQDKLDMRKFKILTACGPLAIAYPDVTTEHSGYRFSWFTYWLGKGLGANPNRETGALGAFDPANLPANIYEINGPAVTLDEAYKYVKANMEKEFTPVFRQYVSVWPSNDKTAIFNLVP